MTWRCTWCGREHERNDPPCASCGHNAFEPADDPRDDQRAVDTGTSYVWVCGDCGREHVKNSPPCSRCYGHELEKRELDYDDVDGDIAVPSWFEVAKPYTPIFLGLVVVIALFATGVVPPNVIPGIDDTPSPPDAPGSGTEADGVDLEAAAATTHGLLDAERETTRAYDDGLVAFATYQNRWAIATDAGDDLGDGPRLGAFDPVCSVEDPVAVRLQPLDEPITGYADEDDLAESLAEEIRELDGGGDVGALATDEAYGAEGIDVHVVEERVYTYYVAC